MKVDDLQHLLPFSLSSFTTLVDLLRVRARDQPYQRAYTLLREGEKEEISLSYAELHQRALAIAFQIQRMGGGEEHCILVVCPPGFDYIAAFFGCLYAGTVAVPVYPPRNNRSLARLLTVIRDTQALAALTTTAIFKHVQGGFAQHAEFQALPWLAVDQVEMCDESDWQPPIITSESLAFLQYTSGSTSDPKGVMLTHANLLHNLQLIKETFVHTSESRGVIWLPPFHDMGLIGGILQPLFVGFPVTLMAPAMFLRNPLLWLETITRSRATVSGGPNFAFDLCARKIVPEQCTHLDLSSWDVAFVGAEPIRMETLERFARVFAPYGFRREAFYHCYGLAEATLIVTGGRQPVSRFFDRDTLHLHTVQEVAATHDDAQELASCGSALRKQELVVVHPTSRTLCAEREVGEIWLRGPGIAQGYWQKPVETEQVFHAYLSDSGQGPFLRTGDMGFLSSREVYITGRLKDVIILRGRNYYPQDIELSCERSHPALVIGSNAAFAVELAGEEQLVVVQELQRHFHQSALQEVIQAILQAISDQHEIMAAAVVLIKQGSIAKTSSGKIQRSACCLAYQSQQLQVLAAWRQGGDNDWSSASDPSLPDVLTLKTPTSFEAWIIRFLVQRLGIASEMIQRDAPVTQYGFDSLIAVDLGQALTSVLGVTPPLELFFAEQSIAELAATLCRFADGEDNSQYPRLLPASPAHTTYPLSYGQQAIWFLQKLAPRSAAYNIAGAVRLLAQIDQHALFRAFSRLVERHACLRTTLCEGPEGVRQYVHETCEHFFMHVEVVGWSDEQVQTYIDMLTQHSFDLIHGPLFQVTLLSRSSTEHVLVVTIHHSIIDFWSISLILSEIELLYTAECTDEIAALPSLSVTYGDYVYWTRQMLAGTEGERLWAYWQGQLGGTLPLLEMVTDRLRGRVQTFRGATHAFTLDTQLTERLQRLGHRWQGSLFMTLMAAFHVLLFNYTQQTDLLVGTETAGRALPEFSPVLGNFSNPVVIRSRITPTWTFEQFYQQVRQTILDALAHQYFPFPLLVERLKVVRDLARSPLFQVAFNFYNTHFPGQPSLLPFGLTTKRVAISTGRLPMELLPLQQQVAQQDITLAMAECAGELVGEWQYNTDLFDPATIEQMARNYQMLLEAILEQPTALLWQLQSLFTDNRSVLSESWQAVQGALAKLDIEEEFVAPRTPTEELIAQLWSGLLSIAQIGIHDNFFMIGGQSILAAQFISQLYAKIHLELLMSHIFENPTIAELAEQVELLLADGVVEEHPLVVVDRSQPIPLSFTQQRLWFLQQLELDNVAYSVPLLLTFHGDLHRDTLARSIQALTARHEILRTYYIQREDQPLQVILPGLEIALGYKDFATAASTPEQCTLLAQEWAIKEAAVPFDLCTAPLWRVTLLHLGETKFALVLVMHHSITDGWSLNLLVQELQRLYQAFLEDQVSPLPPVNWHYADFACWQHRWLQAEVLNTQLAYWQEKLQDAPLLLLLPTDRPRPLMQSSRGARLPLTFSAPITQALKQLASSEGVTLFTVLLTAFKVFLYRYTSQEDIVIGTPVAGRRRSEFENIVGCFVNTLALSTNLSGQLSFVEALERVHATVLGAYDHQDIPFEKVVEGLHIGRSLAYTPVFQVLFTLQNTPGATFHLPNLELQAHMLDNGTARFDLTLDLSEVANRLEGYLEYNLDLFNASTAERMLHHLQTLIEDCATHAHSTLAALKLLATDERLLLLEQWNATPLPHTSEQCLHQLLEAQVERTPDAIALVFEDKTLSYHELNRRANQFAYVLSEHYSSKPGMLVGICMDRSLEMVIVLWGILKAGGAYVPLDPSYPVERLRFIVEQAHLSCIVTCHNQAEFLASLSTVTLLSWKTLQVEMDQVGPANAYSAVTAEHLAYVLYTSGSTGNPKGVMVTHRNVVSFCASMDHLFGRSQSPGTWLAVTNIAFDISILELLWTLTCGCRVVVLAHEHGLPLLHPSNDATSDFSLIAQARRYPVSHMQCTPSLARLLLTDAAICQQLGHLRCLLLGGESLSASLALQVAENLCCPLYNMYGPTETCIWSASHPVVETEGAVPLGRPLANAQMYIVDDSLEPVPPGVVGELLIAGDGVAVGYISDPVQTAEKFIPHPFSLSPGARLYKSGDLARYRPDATIEFLGRRDFQVKLRGFRVELGEIETALLAHPGIRQSVVIVSEADAAEKQLIAYIVPVSFAAVVSEQLGNASLSLDALRQFLRSTLPDYMLPSHVVVLPVLPLTSSGKLDRRALPAPIATSIRHDETVMPLRTPYEQLVSQVWMQILGRTEVGLHDNFFDLGGHSLLLLKVQGKLSEIMGQQIAMTEMFRRPTVSLQAAYFATQPEHLYLTDAPTHPIRGEAQNAVAIVGLAGRFPHSKNLAEFWDNLCQGNELISYISQEQSRAAGVGEDLLDDPHYVGAAAMLEDATQFAASFFGYSPREAEIIDPQQRVLLECAWEALEDAGYDPTACRERIGVYVGEAMNTYLYFNLYPHQELIKRVGQYQTMLGNDKDFLPTRISYKLNLRGPSINVQTACSTSLVAVHLACQSLLRGECDMALAGGVAIHFPLQAGYIYTPGGILSPDGHCRAFSDQAQGTVPGSGVGVVVLKRLEAALKDGDCISAVIKGSAINNDGALKVGYTAPSVDGQAEVITQALANAAVDPSTVSYIETHGTGTALGDPIEVAALCNAYGSLASASCAIGSVKTNMGHLDAAAGVAGLIKTILALRHRLIPPSLHFEQASAHIDFAHSPFYVNTALRAWESRSGPLRAAVSSLGIGGTNAHLILEEAPAAQPSGAEMLWHLLVLSAKTPQALDAATRQLATALKHPTMMLSESTLADVAYTLAVGRQAFTFRRALVCQNWQDGWEVLETAPNRRLLDNQGNSASWPILFLFPGQGSQYIQMGRELYQSSTCFRSHFDACDRWLRPHLRDSLYTIIYPSPEREEEASHLLDQTLFAQLGLFVVEYSLAQLLMSWGIQPGAMIGHSLGEYVAACLAGVFSLEDALALLVVRARLMQDLPGGAMLAVSLSEAETRQYLRTYVGLSLAALNAPALSVVSGPEDAILALQERLESEKKQCRRLHTSHAFHSAIMDTIVQPFKAELSKRTLNVPRLPYISNVTGEWITPAQATNPDYWVRQLRQEVRFAQGVEVATRHQGYLFVEVGPGHMLSTMIRQIDPSLNERTITLLPPPQARQQNAAYLLTGVATLWLHNVPVHWPGFYADAHARRVPLPTYPFERQDYVVTPPLQTQVREGARLSRLGQKQHNLTQWFYVPTWKRTLETAAPRLVGEKFVLPQDDATWLIFAGDDSLSTCIIEYLLYNGRDVIVVRTGTVFAEHQGTDYTLYTLSPRDQESYILLWRCLREHATIPHRILHFWSLTTTSTGLSFAQMQDMGYYSLLFLAQAFLEGEKRSSSTEVSLDLVVISNYLHDIAGDGMNDPGKTTLLGPCKVIPQECSSIKTRCIDLCLPTAGGSDEVRVRAQIFKEIFGDADDLLVAYRGQQRWVQVFEPLQLSESFQPALRKGGVYLITGGLGNIGLSIASVLARDWQACLILVGRTALPCRAEWDEWLLTHSDPISDKIRRIREVERNGSRVLVACADVASESAMQRVLDETFECFGTLHGVLHAAGTTTGNSVYQPLQAIHRAESEEQFLSKVHGLYVLEKLLRGRELDFCCLFSSNAAILGGQGFMAYSAANIFMDAFAEHIAKVTQQGWISVNWDSWLLSTTQDQARPSLQSSTERYALTEEEGVEAFLRVTALTGLSQIVLSSGDLAVRTALWTTRSQAFRSLYQLVDTVAGYVRPLEKALIEPRNEIERGLCTIWQALLGIQQVSIDDNFFELGGHSLLATQIVSEIEEQFGVRLSLRSLFEATTVAELALLVIESLSVLIDEQELVALENLTEEKR